MTGDIRERIARAIEAGADRDESDGPEPFDDWSAAHSSGWLEGLREAARVARETSPWVEVADGLPDQDGRYLVHCRPADPARPLIGVACYHPGDGSWSLIPRHRAEAITHWMEIPEPPR